MKIMHIKVGININPIQQTVAKIKHGRKQNKGQHTITVIPMKKL